MTTINKCILFISAVIFSSNCLALEKCWFYKSTWVGINYVDIHKQGESKRITWYDTPKNFLDYIKQIDGNLCNAQWEDVKEAFTHIIQNNSYPRNRPAYRKCDSRRCEWWGSDYNEEYMFMDQKIASQDRAARSAVGQPAVPAISAPAAGSNEQGLR